ncbi:MAG TPA: PH domain-containing protein [Casimicrobiaceae bacterium]|nr:PH domain-containing protein [Casimicrobiaceae bacterium]
MANYVETIVGPGEQVLYVGKVSLFSILPALIGGTLLILVGGAFTAGAGPVGLIFALLGLIVIVVALIRRNSTELAVTNRRVIAKFGFIKRSTIELNLAKVESIRVEQSIGGRIFGYGSVIVTGTGSTMDPIPYVANPIKFRQAVQSATDTAQKM